MSNGQSVKPCDYCGHTELVYLPQVSVELKKQTSVLGLAAVQGITPYPVVNMLMCTSCGHIEWFAASLGQWQKIFSQIPGATTLRSG